MAGEYSRELSAKVFAGQCRLIELGYRQGGPAGFGLRRQLIDQAGCPKDQLDRGQHKSIQTDRVILIPGPDPEIETVRLIFQSFVRDGKSEVQIADYLNAAGILTDLNRSWTRGTVHQVLINEKYVGNNVWNRCSFKLKRKHVINSPDMWVRSDGAFEALVDRQLFDGAQAIIAERSYKIPDGDMLSVLSNLLKERGHLSGILIDEADGLPSSSIYRHRFGSLLNAYTLVGYTPERDYNYIEINRSLRALYPATIADAVAGVEHAGGHVEHQPNGLLRVNDEFTLSIVIARCVATNAGSLRWHIRLDTGLLPDITVAIRMDANNNRFLDYYLLPTLDMTIGRLRLAEANGAALDCYRFDSLDSLFELTERVRLKEVA